MRRLSWLAKLARTSAAGDRTSPSPPSRRRPRPPARLRLEPLEERALLAMAAAPVAFDPATGVLTIAGSPAGTRVQVATSDDGALAVDVDGQLFSPGANAATLSQIDLAGGGPGDELTLSDLTTAHDLTVRADGTVNLAGDVAVAGRFTVAAAALDVESTARAQALSLTSAGLLEVETGGRLIAPSIVATADEFVNVGQVSADGADGGHVAITARDDLNAGTVCADGTAGAGGAVRIAVSQSYIDTAAARTTARGASAGGDITIDAGASGRLFSSGQFDADGASGGEVDLLGRDLLLVGEAVDASGDADGGRVIVQSQSSTDFAGTISASGGAHGGFIEVSSHGTLTDSGQADAGRGGTVLLDPKDLIIAAAPTGVFPQFNLVNPGSGGTFGSQVATLSTGNIVVVDSTVNSTGAVYLFNGQTGALISALTGTSGSVTVLPSENFVLTNPLWNGNRGAVTWISGAAGLSGTVSAGNSLVGSHSGSSLTGDNVGGGVDPNTGVSSQGVSVLPNGNYIVFSPLWNGKFGAVTWGSGTAGVAGAVSAGDSLVGSASGDEVGGVPGVGGFGFVALKNGNYVVPSPLWNNQTGAATWANGATGLTGTISAANSLVGSSSGDEVGLAKGSLGNTAGITPLSDGNYVVSSVNWSSNLGAATWGNGTTGVTGTISSSNSLVGSNSSNAFGDHVGASVVALTDGNYVVGSPTWNSNLGAATWGSGTAGVKGAVSSSNSLVGSHPGFVSGGGDEVGRFITPLSNGNYVVESPGWNDFDGAATWASGATGLTGTISSSNSLVGSSSGDSDNASTFALPNGNYVVDSPSWNGGRGAVTWGNGSSGTVGTISGGNSLVGSNAGDHVGGEFATGNTFTTGLTVLSNGNYVVDSPNWNNKAGAVTWGNGSTGLTGAVSGVNSLVGSNAGDQVGAHFDASTGTGSGGVTPLANGNYVVASVYWNNKTGAVTWGSGTSGVVGTISSANSLIGAVAGGAVGGRASAFVNGVTALPNGNYVVVSPDFAGGKGAATWGNGTAGTTGIVSSANSLVGSAAGDQVGNAFTNVVALSDGNYVVDSPNWNGNLGAVTWASGTSGATLDGQHTIDPQNSIEGTVAGASGISGPEAGTLTGSFVVPFPDENGGVVTVGFTDPNLITAALDQRQTLSITPDLIERTLAAGTTATLQATDSIAIGSLTLNGPISPGNGFLKLDAPSVAFQSGSSYAVQLNGTSPGTGFDQLQVTGAIDLSKATLSVSTAGDLTKGQTFVILTSTQPITTAFAGLPEGGTISGMTISYQNDQVTLTLQSPTSTPTPTTPTPTPTSTPTQVAGLPALTRSKKGVTAISVRFNQPLVPASASNLGVYHLLGAVKKRKKTVYTRPVKIKSVTYAAASDMVTIGLARPLKGKAELIVDGAIEAMDGTTGTVHDTAIV